MFLIKFDKKAEVLENCFGTFVWFVCLFCYLVGIFFFFFFFFFNFDGGSSGFKCAFVVVLLFVILFIFHFVDVILSKKKE